MDAGRQPPSVRSIEQAAGVAGRARREQAHRLGHLARRPLLRLRDPRGAGEILLRLARRADRLHGLFQEFMRQEGPRFRRVLGQGFPDRALPFHRQGHPLLPRPVLARRTGTRRLPHADQRLRPRLPDRRRRQDVEVARHLHHRRKLPGAGAQPGMAALLLRRQAQWHHGGHRPQPRRLHPARQFRPGRQVHQHRQPRRRLHRQALRRPSCSTPTSPTAFMPNCPAWPRRPGKSPDSTKRATPRAPCAA
jgi:hypothetical protein